jgi:hypothetical protein
MASYPSGTQSIVSVMEDTEIVAPVLPAVPSQPSTAKVIAEQLAAVCATPVAVATHVYAGLPLGAVVAGAALSTLWLMFCRGARHAREWNDTLKHIHDTWRPPGDGPGP